MSAIAYKKALHSKNLVPLVNLGVDFIWHKCEYGST